MLSKNQNRTYEVEPYNPAWVGRFEDIKKLLQSVFGERALSIEHVGSTSVPGMTAKPVIDVLVVVTQMSAFSVEKEAMVKAGYEWDADYIAPATLIFYKLEKGGDRKIENIHVCPAGSASVSQFLDIRDFLRAHSEWAKKYALIKEALVLKFHNDYISYREGKQNFLRQLLLLAKEWKKI